MNKGCMIVCDGGNGAGKTTVIKAIEEHLIRNHFEVVVTREPGGTRIGEKIREVLLSADTPEMCDITELMLFGAARAQHLQEKILPAIQAGKIVVSDRFVAATISFQHFARGLNIDVINQINELVLDGFKPDMNIILDLDPVIGLQRVHSRGEGLDRLEAEKLGFLEKARYGYLEQAQNSPESFQVVDASQPIEAVISKVLKIVDGVVMG
jgi:dTMP kinase